MRGGAGRGEVRRPGRDGRCEAAGERRSGRDGRCEAAGERLMEMSALILGEIEGLRNVRELRGPYWLHFCGVGEDQGGIRSFISVRIDENDFNCEIRSLSSVTVFARVRPSHLHAHPGHLAG